MFDLNTHLQYAVHGGADSGDGLAGAVEGFLSFISAVLTLSPGDMFAAILPGISTMENMHPLLVHFPIALLLSFVVLDFLGSLLGKSNWRGVASWFLYSGTLMAVFTVAAGLIAADSVAHGDEVHAIMEHHEHLGISLLLLAGVLTLWRLLAKPLPAAAANTLYLLLAGVMSVLILFTADLGGLMVYEHGVAVRPVRKMNQAATALHEHGDVIPDTNLPVASSPDSEPKPGHRHQGHAHDHNHVH